MGTLLTLNQPRYSPTTPIDPRVEMFQRGQAKDAFFNMKQLGPRPMSDATEMFDTDFEEDESEIEDNNSPRLSINSVSVVADQVPTPLTAIHRAVNEVGQRYPPLRRYTRQVQTPMSSKASTSASQARLR